MFPVGERTLFRFDQPCGFLGIPCAPNSQEPSLTITYLGLWGPWSLDFFQTPTQPREKSKDRTWMLCGVPGLSLHGSGRPGPERVR